MSSGDSRPSSEAESAASSREPIGYLRKRGGIADQRGCVDVVRSRARPCNRPLWPHPTLELPPAVDKPARQIGRAEFGREARVGGVQWSNLVCILAT